MEFLIEKLVYGGDGMSRLPADEHGGGKAVFVRFVLEGERVEAAIVEEKSGFARARLEKVLAPSDKRIEPTCPYFQRCGGCHYQHTDYQHQLEIKTNVLRESVRRLAKTELADIEVHASPPWNYRNRTRMKVRGGASFAMGYFRHGSHDLLPVEECPISSPLINRAIAKFWELGRAGGTEDSTREVQFFADAEDEHLLIELYVDAGADERQLHAIYEELKDGIPVVGLAIFDARGGSAEDGVPAPRQAERTASLKTFFDESALTYSTASGQYRVSAGSFFQTNRFLTGELISIVCGGQSGETALDLYAGTGLFAQVLARSFRKVFAVEASPSSFEDLKANLPPPAKVYRSTTDHFLEQRGAKIRPELVVVDPPRAGLGEKVTRALCATSAMRVTYVSCDPSTLSRDLRLLLQSGFRIEKAHLVDLFPQTFHIESVLHLAR